MSVVDLATSIKFEHDRERTDPSANEGLVPSPYDDKTPTMHLVLGIGALHVAGSSIVDCGSDSTDLKSRIKSLALAPKIRVENG